MNLVECYVTNITYIGERSKYITYVKLKKNHNSTIKV